jgi:hypothetical protein
MLLIVMTAACTEGLGAAEPAFAPRSYQSTDELPADLRTIRDRWLDLQTLRAASPELDPVRNAVDGMTRSAASLVKGQITDPADPNFGSWGDVKGLKDDAISYHGGYYGKPFALARAYACPHSDLHRSPEVLAALNAALRFGAQFYHVDMERPNNWWAWDIGSPMRINAALLLAGGDIDPDLRAQYIEALYFEGNQPRSLGFEKPGTGANAIWIAGNAMRLALLTGDEALMARASAIFADIAQVKGPKGDGIMPDGSFHQHGNGINMGYGAAMLVDVAEYLHLTAGTAYALPESSIEAMTRFFADYAVWDSYKGKFNPYSSGRAATRPRAFRSGAAATAAVYFLEADVQAARPAALATLRDYSGGDAGNVLRLVPALAGKAAGHLKATRKAGLISGVRALPYSDMVISRSPAHFLSVRLAADTKGWFSIANENLKAYQVGEGSIVMLTDGRELEQDTAINQPWDGLPGVTHCGELRRPRETVSQSELVGCASTTNAGLIAADYVLTEEGASLTGKKAYFLFGNLLVLLGTDLRCSLDEPVITTLFSNPVRDEETALLRGELIPVADAGGELAAEQECLYRGSGLVLLDGRADVSAETLRTPYAEVNARSHTDDTFENTYLRITSASEAGEAGAYQALIAAGVGGKQFRGMARKPPVRVSANTSAIQGVLWSDRKAGAVAVYTEGGCEAGGLSARGGLVWERRGDRVEMVISRRNAEAERLEVTVPLPLEAPSAGRVVSSTASGTTIRLDLPGGYIVEQVITASVAD